MGSSGDPSQFGPLNGLGLVVELFKKLSESGDIEDNWRGASRLADWASTRMTMFPHPFNSTELAEMNLYPAQARRYVDIYFLRRDEPTEPFSAHLDPNTGWWGCWEPPKHEASTFASSPKTVSADDVLVKLAEKGAWVSREQALDDLTRTGASQRDARRVLDKVTGDGFVLKRLSGRRAIYLLGWDGRKRVEELGAPVRGNPKDALARDGFADDQIADLLPAETWDDEEAF
jgi:hypothetical protein